MIFLLTLIHKYSFEFAHSSITHCETVESSCIRSKYSTPQARGLHDNPEFLLLFSKPSKKIADDAYGGNVDIMNNKEREHEIEKERETQRELYNRAELRERMAWAISEDGVAQPLPGLHLTRFSTTKDTIYGATEPSFCVIAQGSKEVCLGEKCYQYDPYNYLWPLCKCPWWAEFWKRSGALFGLRLSLDPTLVGSIMLETGGLSPGSQGDRGSQGDAKAITVSALDATLLDVVVRLVRLLDSPIRARLLLPLVTREIIYWLLVGEQGDRLRQMTMPGGHTHRIGRPWIRFAGLQSAALRRDIAVQIGMSVSGFHHHFKAVTA